MIFPYVMEGENVFYFLIIARAIRALIKVVILEEIVMAHGVNTSAFLHSSATLECDSSNKIFSPGQRI